MDKTLSKVRNVIAIVLVGIVILAGLGVYMPMKRELIKNLQHNFLLSTEAHHFAIEKTINDSINDARSLSNDDILKQKIAEYGNGIVNFTELKDYTSRRYSERIQHSKEEMGAFRIIDGKILVEKGKVDLSKSGKIENISELTTEVEEDGLDSTTLIVYSPIKDDNRLLGFDVVFFNMSDVLNSIHTHVMQHQLYTKEEMEQIVSNKHHVVFDDNMHLITDGESSWYVQSVEPIGMYFVASISNSALYESLSNISLVVFISFIIAIIAITFSMHFISIKYFRNIIERLKQSREMYKKFATTDSLTGAYSRMYFNQYIDNYYDENQVANLTSVVVMIDVNKFKHINDAYGHLIGDAVLKKIADILKGSVRDGDIVVRYGGDEFLILLRNCGIEMSKQVISRISKKLSEVHEFNFPIEVSYGMAEIMEKDKLIQVIKEADEKMYKLKHSQ